MTKELYEINPFEFLYNKYDVMCTEIMFRAITEHLTKHFETPVVNMIQEYVYVILNDKNVNTVCDVDYFNASYIFKNKNITTFEECILMFAETITISTPANKRCQQLELENKSLKDEISQLKDELTRFKIEFETFLQSERKQQKKEERKQIKEKPSQSN